jgi:3D (Asp-Asp-Asp) domain-containing protein
VSLILSLIVFHGGHTVPTPPKPTPVAHRYTVTAYTADCLGCTGIAANGSPPTPGVTVACPPYLELGTWLEIEDIGRRRCDDRGGAIRGRRLDLFIPSLRQAIEFGRQSLKVEILD